MRFPIDVNEDIGRLEIAVDKALLMCWVHCLGDASQQVHQSFERKLPCLEDLRQRLAIDVFEDNVDTSVLLSADIIDRNDRRVAELGGHPGLIEKQFDVLIRLECFSARHFDSDCPLEIFVPREVDPPKRSRSQASEHGIAANLRRVAVR